MDKKTFLENFKISKALKGFEAKLSYGDKLQMFNCMHKVISFDLNGFTILEDEKKSRFAIPTPKVLLLMKSGLAKNYGAIVLTKSVNAPASRGTSSGDGKPGPKGEPVGTMKQGGDGEWYKKISMAPSQWVHVGKGTAHVAPGSDAMHPLTNKEDQKKFLAIRELIRSNTPSSEHNKLEQKAMAWANALHQYKNKFSYHTSGEVDAKGNKLPNNMPQHALDDVYRAHDRVLNAKKALFSAIKTARQSKG